MSASKIKMTAYAQAVARAVLRDGPEPRAVVIEDEAAVLELMNRERDLLMTLVDRLRNQLHNRLFQVDPEYRKSFPSLSKLATIQNLEQYTAVADSPLASVRGAAGRRVASLLPLVLEQHQQITREIESLSGTRYGALTDIQDVARLTAGILARILGTRVILLLEDQFATYGGASLIETSSTPGPPPSQSGRRLPARVLYLIALTQWNQKGAGRNYIERRMEQGKSRLEAVRALKRSPRQCGACGNIIALSNARLIPLWRHHNMDPQINPNNVPYPNHY